MESLLLLLLVYTGVWAAALSPVLSSMVCQLQAVTDQQASTILPAVSRGRRFQRRTAAAAAAAEMNEVCIHQPNNHVPHIQWVQARLRSEQQGIVQLIAATYRYPPRCENCAVLYHVITMLSPPVGPGMPVLSAAAFYHHPSLPHTTEQPRRVEHAVKTCQHCKSCCNTRPTSSGSRQARARSSSVLPTPEGPRRNQISPGYTWQQQQQQQQPGTQRHLVQHVLS
jgi:hypothetical protein